jgi:RimJ/RimL family protein N-acetyltransferase
MIGDANYRGKGIGREVMELIERVAFSLLGLARLKFPVVEENMVALKMYAKSGYRRAGFSGEEFRKDGRSLPVTMLVKDR